MTWTVRLASAADRDLVRLAAFLKDRSPNSVAPMRTALWNAIVSLRDSPHRGFAGPDSSFREIVVGWGKSAYVLQYRVGTDVVLVTRIFHGRENR